MTDAQEQDRQEQLDQLYTQNYGFILDTALADRRLLPQDGERIAQSLAHHLCLYEGPLDSEAFRKWAEDVITPAASRLSFFYQLQEECGSKVRAGIFSILRQNLDLRDHTSTAYILEQIEADTWVWACNHLDDLMVPGTAKPSTRLYSQGKFHALTWRKTRLRALERFDDSDVERYGLMEIMEEDESGESKHEYASFYDPGGHDDDEEDEPPRKQTKFLPIPAPRDGILAMRSGIPKLLCPVCQSLQAISPDPPTEPDWIRLGCGHERTSFLGRRH